MILTYDATAHIYTLDGAVVPSVTQVLALTGLTRWGQGELSDEAAMARGRAVHRQCAQYELDAVTLAEIPEVYRGYVASWATLKTALSLKTEEVEMVVASRRHRYAGRLDWVGWMDNRLTILDWKSGPPGPEAALQTAAYSMAYREMTGSDGLLPRASVHLQADGTMARLIPYTDWMDGPRFLAALSVVQTRQAYGLLKEENDGHDDHYATD